MSKKQKCHIIKISLRYFHNLKGHFINTDAPMEMPGGGTSITEVISESTDSSHQENVQQMTSTPVKENPPPFTVLSSTDSFSLPSAIFGSSETTSSSESPLNKKLDHHVKEMEKAVSSEDISEGELDTQLTYHLNKMEEAAAKMTQAKKEKFFSSMLAGKLSLIYF